MHPILVTGGAGFIGGEFVRQWVAEEASAVVNLDKLTYAGNLDSLAAIAGNPRHSSVRVTSAIPNASVACCRNTVRVPS